MSDDFNGLRTSLKQLADGFGPPLDASALAKTGRARSQRRMIIGGVAGTLALAVAAVMGVPVLLGPPTPVPAAPAAASAPPSELVPTFDPNRPSSGGTGNNAANQFDSMRMPVPGAVVPDGSWKTITMPPANLQVQYPPDWTVTEQQWGVSWIIAPSGYIIVLRRMRSQ